MYVPPTSIIIYSWHPYPVNSFVMWWGDTSIVYEARIAGVSINDEVLYLGWLYQGDYVSPYKLEARVIARSYD